MPRMTSVRVWVPAMPPMLATMGISTARATTFAMVSSKMLITAAAMNVVRRLTPSQRARLFTDFMMGAKVSSSRSRPALASTASSASSMMTSTTSSMVIRPIRRPSSSTTGAEIRSCSENSRATSVSGVSAGIDSASVSITSRTVTVGSEVIRLASDTMPTYSSLWFTTMSASVASGRSLRRRR